MLKGNWSRRGFLACLTSGLVATGLPVWFFRDRIAQALGIKRRRTSATDRIVMGAIGVGTNRTRHAPDVPIHGTRGISIMKKAMHESGVQMISVCDVDQLNADFAKQQVETARHGGVNNCSVTSDFRTMLENREIDAVTIGTPDHWHALIAIAAMRAGKDVYCEKPMTLTIAEAQSVARVALQTQRIFQVGTQQRTEFDGRFRLVAELVRNGRLGRIERITALIGANPTGGPFAPQSVPAELDWDFWRGPLPETPFFPQRCHYDFRWWYETSGGKLTDWGAHHLDIAQWALGMDDSGPNLITAQGTAPPSSPNSYNVHPAFEVVYTYGNGPAGSAGTCLSCRSAPPPQWTIRETISGAEKVADNGLLFEGENNQWLWVSRNTVQSSERRLLDEPLPPGAERLPRADLQMANFLDCVRSRENPICSAAIGHRSVSVCHLGVIALRFFPGQALEWNPRAERFTGQHAEAANQHLNRPMRAPWRLEG